MRKYKQFQCAICERKTPLVVKVEREFHGAVLKDDICFQCFRELITQGALTAANIIRLALEKEFGKLSTPNPLQKHRK